MNEFVSQFLLEARELTEQATQDLLALEQAPANKERLESAFRAFHTLKGAAGIMEYAPMERLLHQAEDRLQGLRHAHAVITPAIIDQALAAIGQVIRWLDVIALTGDLPADAEQSVARIMNGPQTQVQAVAPQAPSDWVDGFLEWVRRRNSAALPRARTAVRYAPPADAFFKGLDPVALAGTLPGLVALRLTPRTSWPTLAGMQPFDCNLIIEALTDAPREDIARTLVDVMKDVLIADVAADEAPAPVALLDMAHALIDAQLAFVRTMRPAEALAGVVGSAGRVIANVLEALGREADAQRLATEAARAMQTGDAEPFLESVAGIRAALAAPAPSAKAGGYDPPREIVASAIRVDVAKVDRIVDLTGELLVVKNAYAHLARLAGEGASAQTLASALTTHTARLERHVTDLQRAVLDLRVLPVSRVFARFPLLVRETASKLGKDVAFRSEGDQTLADKAVVEALFEPLLHVVRNAIDHGIEPPSDRVVAGKPGAAVISMRAWREGQHVVVEVVDDGRGVDTAVVRQLAISRGVITKEAAAGLDELATVNLIFAPGFTTASQVTDLSGRGVGMNVVRSSIQRMGGQVSLSNRPGQGLTIRFTLPFTVMMTRVMTVEAGGQVFGLPFDQVLETIRVPRTKIMPFGGGEAIILRDTTIPVLNLAAHLELDLQQAHRADNVCLVIASLEGQPVAVEVDRPGERLDLMLKPVEGILAGIKAVSGTSLLGDGRVLVVLDLGALFG